jgi:hypothetical protein
MKCFRSSKVLAAAAAGALLLVAASGGTAKADTTQASAPQASASPATAASAADLCQGIGGVASNLLGAVTGGLNPAILAEPDLGTPYLDGNVVRADSSVQFYSWGSCADQVAFQMQEYVCGFWGCNWVIRNHGIPEFFWAHDDTGVVAQQVTMGCRPGTHSYRVQMQVYGVSSSGDVNPADGEPEAIGVESDNDTETGPAVQLTC